MITSTSEKGRVAVMCCGHKEYWPQFPGMREEVINYMNEIAGYVQSSQAELLESRFVDNIDDSIAYGRDLKAKGCDLLILYVPAYIASGRYMQGVIAAECPVVVVGMQKAYKMSGEITIQKVTTDGGPCAIPEAYSAMVRSGLNPAGLVFGKACGDPHIINEIHEWCRVANALHAFKGSRFGYIGHSYEGMMDMNFDPTAVTKEFGAYVCFPEMCEVVDYIEKCSDEDLAKKMDEIKETFDIVDASYDRTTKQVDNSDIEWSAKVAVALDKVVEKHGLSGLVYYYMGENNSIYERAASNFIIGNTPMTTKGISMAGEADMKTCLAMYLTSALGCGGSFSELVGVDFDADCLIVGHDGPHDIRISDRKPRIRGLGLMHGKKGYGCSVEFSIKHGPMTMVAVGSDANGKFRLIVAEGESQEGWVPEIGNTLTRGYFGPNIVDFIENWSKALPPHHQSLSVGHNASLIEKFGKVMGIEVFRIR